MIDGDATFYEGNTTPLLRWCQHCHEEYEIGISVAPPDRSVGINQAYVEEWGYGRQDCACTKPGEDLRSLTDEYLDRLIDYARDRGH